MIQIQRHNLTELSQKHYKSLKNAIIRRLENKNGNLFEFIKNNLGKILEGNPYVLSNDIIAKIPYKSSNKKEVEGVFNYKHFTKKHETNYNAYSLADSLQVNVCPYCNRQYTFTVIANGTNKGQTRPEFDHFFSQAKYPYLALSFYNLIPSCKICNSTFKHNKDWNLENYIHPYVEGFDKCKFSIRPKLGKGIDFFYGKTDAFDIEFKNSTSKTENNIRDLELHNLYNKHKDYVAEILQRSLTYSDAYVNQLCDQYGWEHYFQALAI